MNNIATDRSRVSIDTLIKSCKSGFTLPQDFYTNQDVLEADLEQVFKKQWLLVDHASRIPNKGDYFIFEIESESIIVVREDESTVNAFYNVCRHRGSKICTEKEGNTRYLRCPYHAWSYNLDGSFKAARSMPDDFDGNDYGLHQVHVKLFHSVIFLNLSDGVPANFDEIYSEYEPIMNLHGFSKAKIGVKKLYPQFANWKLVVENFLECYHCAPSHPEYCSVHAPDQLLAIGAGPGSGPDGAEEIYRPKIDAWQEKSKAMGYPTVNISSGEDSFAYNQCSRFPINDSGAVSETIDGKPACAKLMGEFTSYDGGESAIGFNPVSFILAFNDFALMFRFTPRGVLTTDVELTWLVHEDAEPGVDFDPDRVSHVWDITTQQDKRITQDNQDGVLSRRYQPGPYSLHENGIASVSRWYLKQLERAS